MLQLRSGIKATSTLKQSISIEEAEAMMAHTTFSSHYQAESIHKREIIDAGWLGRWDSEDTTCWILLGFTIGLWFFGIIIAIICLFCTDEEPAKPLEKEEEEGALIEKNEKGEDNKNVQFDKGEEINEAPEDDK